MKMLVSLHYGHNHIARQDYLGFKAVKLSNREARIRRDWWSSRRLCVCLLRNMINSQSYDGSAGHHRTVV